MRKKQPLNCFSAHNEFLQTPALLLSLPTQPHGLSEQFALKQFALNIFLHVTVPKLKNLMEKDLSGSFSRSL